jgi:hypothetical protein
VSPDSWRLYFAVLVDGECLPVLGIAQQDLVI